MNPTTILTIFATVLPIALAALLELRNYKYDDKNSKAYHRISKVVFLLWIASGIIVPWAAYVALKPDTQTELKLYANGKPIDGNTSIVVPPTNGQYEIILSVDNIGNASAENVVVGLAFAASLKGFSAEGTWHEQAGLSELKNGKHVHLNDIKYYEILADRPIPVGGSSFQCNPVKIKRDECGFAPVKTIVFAMSTNAKRIRRIVTFKFSP